MSGWLSLLRLNMTLLRRRRLPMWIAGTALLTAVLSTATAGVEDGEGFRAVASAARLLAAALIVLTAVLGAVSISGDAATGALRAVMIRPVSRTALVCAQAVTTSGFAAVIYLVGIGLSWAIAAASFGFGDVTFRVSNDVSYQVIELAEMSDLQIRLLLLALPSLLVAPLIALCVSVVTDDSATAVVLALVATLGPLLFGLVTGASPEWFFTERALAPLGALHQLARGIQLQQDVVASPEYLWDALWQPTAWAAVCLTVAILAFRRREISA